MTEKIPGDRDSYWLWCAKRIRDAKTKKEFFDALWDMQAIPEIYGEKLDG